MDLDDIRKRLQKLAEDAARDDEKATLTIGTRADVPAWQAEVSWVGPNGQREWSGYAGRLEDLETHTAIQIAARKQRIDRENAAPPPPSPPSPGDTIRDARQIDSFRKIRH